jgi:hypothetical protein
MKAESALLSLYHIEPGRHREATMWHDADHKAEVIGSLATVFISQRWVTPPEWRPYTFASALPDGGGEYINLYWSSEGPDDLQRDFSEFGRQMTAAGRMKPVQYMTKTWPEGSSVPAVPVLAQSRPGLEISGAAVTASMNMTALMTVIEVVHDDAERAAFGQWHEQVYLPMVLGTGLFAGVAKLAMASADEPGRFVTLYYLDASAPAEAYSQFKQTAAGWGGETDLAPPVSASYQLIFESLARPSIGNYDFYE